MLTDDIESAVEKINRKRKADDSCQTESNDFVPDQGEAGMKKKKKKQEKSSENQSSTGNQGTAKDEGSAGGKRVKKAATPDAKPSEDKVKAAAGGDATAAKKEKKPKKSENKENIAEKQEPPPKTASKQSVKPPKSNNDQQGEGEKVASKPKKVKTDAASSQENFDWKATIMNVLQQDAKDSRIQLQKLQKKVLKLHSQAMNCENSDKKKSKFMQKLKEIPSIVMDNDFVVLKS